MRIACLLAAGPGTTDRLLGDLARRCLAAGLAVAGAVQEDREAGEGRKCHMDLLVLPELRPFRISQDRGRLARGCRLDADALEAAAADTLRRLGPDIDLLILSKFGRHEAEGRGFRPVIAEAVALGLPVLTAVGPLNREAFERFTAGAARMLAPERPALDRWLAEVLATPPGPPAAAPRPGAARPAR